MISTGVRALVRERANHHCEYCQLAETDAPYTPFHVEHIIPRKHGGTDEPHNLALACLHCNLHKGPNLAGIDRMTNEVVVLFNPRRDAWGEHLAFSGIELLGLTPTGRATVMVFAMNSPSQLALREALAG